MAERTSLSGAPPPLDGPVRIELWCARALAAVAGVAVGAAFLSLAEVFRGAADAPLWVPTACGILVLPYLGHRAAARPEAWDSGSEDRRAGSRRARRRRHRFELAIAVLQLLLWAHLGTGDAVALVPGGLLLAQGWLMAKSRADAAAGAAVGVGLLQVLLAVATAPGALSLLALPAQLGLATAALVLLHARASRRRVRRPARAHEIPDEEPGALRGRLSYSAALAFAVALLAVLLHQSAQVASQAPGTAREPAGDEGGALTRPTPRPGAQVPAGPGESTFPTDLDYGSALNPLSEERFLEVRLWSGAGERFRPPGAVLLKGLNLDRFTPTGAELAVEDAPRTLADADDGEADGSIRVAAPAALGEELELEIRQQPLPMGAGRHSPLFRVEPLSAVAVDGWDEVRYDPAGVLTTAEPVDALLRYRVRTPVRDLAGSRLHAAGGAGADPRYLQLPAASADLDWLAARAREIAAGSATQYERVQRVVAHFRGYDYSFLSTGFQGTAGLRAFLERRTGFCTYFASAATLLLRTLEVPARIATGFQAREWSEERGCFVVRGRDAHAWVEVWFAGVGWVAFDPTPADAAEEAAERMRNPELESELDAWSRDFGARLRSWSETNEGFRELVAALARLPLVLLASLRGRPLLLVAALALSALLVGLLLRRFLGRAVGRALAGAGLRAPGRGRSDFYYDRLLRALARLDFHKRAAQTPREFAREVARRGGEPFRPLEDATELLYRDRFGGVGLSPAEARSIEAFLAALRQRARDHARDRRP